MTIAFLRATGPWFVIAETGQSKLRGALYTGSRVYRTVSFLCAALFLLAGSVAAQAHQERVILALTEGGCTVRLEADDQSRTLRLRILPEATDCRFSKTAMQTVLTAAFAKTDPPKLEGSYSSLFLGRLIDYPWLSEHLALAASSDPRWNKRTGRPVSMELHAYVKAMLTRSAVTAQFEETFGKSGYRVAAVTVEKVLVGRRGDVPMHAGNTFSGKVPFDAMVWLILEMRKPGDLDGVRHGAHPFRTDWHQKDLPRPGP